MLQKEMRNACLYLSKLSDIKQKAETLPKDMTLNFICTVF